MTDAFSIAGIIGGAVATATLAHSWWQGRNRPPLQPKPPSLTEPQAAPPTGQRIAKPTRRRP